MATPVVILGHAAALPYAAVAPVPFVGAAHGAVAPHPVVKAVVEPPAVAPHEVTAHAVPVAAYGYGHLGYGHGYYGKRDADPAVLAGGSRIISPPTPLIHNPPAIPHVVAPYHVAAPV